MTDRLYYHDPLLSTFTATVVEAADEGRRIYLDCSAFYPTSGGQPYDLGTINGIAILDVIDEEERVAHMLASPLEASQADCRIDMTRRLDHMQQHTGQHLLSAVLDDLYGIATLSFHLGQESSTIDINAPSMTAEQITATENRINQLIWENRPVTVTFEDSSVAKGLRKPSEREGILRIVNIENLDRSACGGTHVCSTGAIGLVLIRKLDKMRGTVRMEFLCGQRALTRARRDFETLSTIARTFSSPVDQTPELAATAVTKAADLEKANRKLAVELATMRGRDLYSQTAPDANGLRHHVLRHPKGAIDDELRALAQSFTAGEKAVFIASFEQPPALMLAASKDSSYNAGAILKPLLAEAGGRGGGNPQIAQGSVPTPEALETLLGLLKKALN